MDEILDSVDAIEVALGGRPSAMEKLSVTASTLSGWKVRGIPPARYKQISDALSPLGKQPADHLFFERPPAPQPAPEAAI